MLEEKLIMNSISSPTILRNEGRIKTFSDDRKPGKSVANGLFLKKQLKEVSKQKGNDRELNRKRPGTSEGRENLGLRKNRGNRILLVSFLSHLMVEGKVLMPSEVVLDVHGGNPEDNSILKAGRAKGLT